MKYIYVHVQCYAELKGFVWNTANILHTLCKKYLYLSKWNEWKFFSCVLVLIIVICILYDVTQAAIIKIKIMLSAMLKAGFVLCI